MTAQIIRFPGFNKELIRRYLEARAASTDPAEYPGQDVSTAAFSAWDGRRKEENDAQEER